MIVTSSLTHEEHYRLFGNLPNDRIESLLDESQALEGVEGVKSYIEEARGSVPAGEDVLSEEIGTLRDILKDMRKNNKSYQALHDLLEDLIEKQEEINRGGEYAIEQINNALRDIRTSNIPG